MQFNIRWTSQATKSLEKTLEYWAKRNYSTIYSNKIIDETQKIEKQISDNPYFLSHFVESIGLYKRIFFKGKFSLYYQIIEEENLIIINYFRSNRQKPL